MGKIADLNEAWNHLQEEFANPPETGYVWTINIDSASTCQALGMVKVNYHLKLSCSHVGESMFGAWGGEMAFDTKCDYGGLKALLAVMGSASRFDSDVWFRNDRFLMKLRPYSLSEETEFVEDFVKPLCQAGDSPAAAAGAAYVNAIQQAAISGKNISRTLVNAAAPAGYYNGYYTHMTEGDLSQYAKINGFISLARVKAEAEIDKEGKHLESSARARLLIPPFVNVDEHESIDEDLETPFPYSISVFSDNSVLLRLYSSNGGPICVNFFGTMDKIPVSETTKI